MSDFLTLKSSICVDHVKPLKNTHEWSYFNKNINKFIFRHASGYSHNRFKCTITSDKILPENCFLVMQLYYDDSTFVNDQSILNISNDGLFSEGAYSHYKSKQTRFPKMCLLNKDEQTTFFFRIEASSNDMANIHRGRGFVIVLNVLDVIKVKIVSNTIYTCPIISLSKYRFSRPDYIHKINDKYGDEKMIALESDAKMEVKLQNFT